MFAGRWRVWAVVLASFRYVDIDFISFIELVEFLHTQLVTEAVRRVELIGQSVLCRQGILRKVEAELLTLFRSPSLFHGWAHWFLVMFDRSHL